MRKKIVLLLGILMLVGATAATQGCFVENPNDGYGFSSRWQAENYYRGWRAPRPGPGHFSCDRFGNNCVER